MVKLGPFLIQSLFNLLLHPISHHLFPQTKLFSHFKKLLLVKILKVSNILLGIFPNLFYLSVERNRMPIRLLMMLRLTKSKNSLFHRVSEVIRVILLLIKGNKVVVVLLLVLAWIIRMSVVVKVWPWSGIPWNNLSVYCIGLSILLCLSADIWSTMLVFQALSLSSWYLSLIMRL